MGLPTSQCPPGRGQDPRPLQGGAPSQHPESLSQSPGTAEPSAWMSKARGGAGAAESPTQQDLPARPLLPPAASWALPPPCVGFLPGPWALAVQGAPTRHFIALLLPVTTRKGALYPVLSAEEARAQGGGPASHSWKGRASWGWAPTRLWGDPSHRGYSRGAGVTGWGGHSVVLASLDLSELVHKLGMMLAALWHRRKGSKEVCC